MKKLLLLLLIIPNLGFAEKMKYLILICLLPFSAVAESWVCNFDKYTGYLAKPQSDLITFTRKQTTEKSDYFIEDFNGLIYDVGFENNEYLSLYSAPDITPYGSTMIIEKDSKISREAFVSSFGILTREGKCKEVK